MFAQQRSNNADGLVTLTRQATFNGPLRLKAGRCLGIDAKVEETARELSTV